MTETSKVPDFDIDNGRIQFPILNRVIFGDRVMQNATIIVSCNEGFSVSQPSMIVCSSNRIWTAPMPHCLRGEERFVFNIVCILKFYSLSTNPWGFTIIWALVLLLTVLVGISLISWMKFERKTSNGRTHIIIR